MRIWIGLVPRLGLREIVTALPDESQGLRVKLRFRRATLDLVVPDPQISDLVLGRLALFDIGSRTPLGLVSRPVSRGIGSKEAEGREAVCISGRFGT